MEFLPEQEIISLLEEFGITETPQGDSFVLLEMGGDHCVAHDSLCKEGDCDLLEGSCYTLEAHALIDSTCEAARRVHQGQSVLIPAGKWRSVFDAVAFSMATNEAWQEFDACATTMLNTRDPLLCEAGDEQLLSALLHAVMQDGEGVEQSLFFIPSGAPILMHIQPEGPVQLWFGNQALADRVSGAYKD
ncbi:MAG: hypothetical protein QGI78_00700 [Phycisphaerales bacterium]|nr:hypothetical protein [Phycisphaerales bacterium]